MLQVLCKSYPAEGQIHTLHRVRVCLYAARFFDICLHWDVRMRREYFADYTIDLIDSVYFIAPWVAH